MKYCIYNIRSIMSQEATFNQKWSTDTNGKSPSQPVPDKKSKTSTSNVIEYQGKKDFNLVL